MIRLLIGDKQAVIRTGIVCTLANIPDISVIGEFPSFKHLEQLAHKVQPDLLLVNSNISGLSFINEFASFIQQHPRQKILVLTGETNPLFIHRLFEVGTSSCLHLNDSLSLVLPAIHTSLQGGLFLSQTTLKLFRAGKSESIDCCLNNRELAALELLTKGKTDREISHCLHVSERTVRRDLNRIYEKMNVTSRLQAVVEATRLGLLDSRHISEPGITDSSLVTQVDQ